MSIKVEAYKCEKCGELYETKEEANKCCKCTQCKNYIGKYDKIGHYVHCRCGYTCDSFFNKGLDGTFSRFEII